jgi:hypothetical protein
MQGSHVVPRGIRGIVERGDATADEELHRVGVDNASHLGRRCGGGQRAPLAARKFGADAATAPDSGGWWWEGRHIRRHRTHRLN